MVFMRSDTCATTFKNTCPGGRVRLFGKHTLAPIADNVSIYDKLFGHSKIINHAPRGCNKIYLYFLFFFH